MGRKDVFIGSIKGGIILLGTEKVCIIKKTLKQERKESNTGRN